MVSVLSFHAKNSNCGRGREVTDDAASLAKGVLF